MPFYPRSSGGSSPGPSITRAVATYTTASLATNASEAGTVAIAKAYSLFQIETDRAARVRLYTTVAKQVADESRSTGELPTGNHGLVLDFVTSAELLVSDLTPAIEGFNVEGTPSVNVPIYVTNLGSEGIVVVTFKYLRAE